jgi:TolB protein
MPWGEIMLDRVMRRVAIFGAGTILALLSTGAAFAEPVGQFADHADIGGPKLAGAASFDAATGTYRVSGGGQNMWADHDAFQFAWKKMSGDVVAQADLDFLSPAPAATALGYIHRKGGIILRQDLDPDSAYVDVLRMGNHQLSLQYREVKGGPTRLIWIDTDRQQTVKLEKIGDYAYLSVPGPDGKLRRAGGSFKLRITGTYYIGLGVCAHDDGARETMAFRNVSIAPLTARPARASVSTLQTMQVSTVAEQTALHRLPGRIEVAGWSTDSKSILYRAGPTLYRAGAWDSGVVAKVAGAAPALAPAPGPADWIYTSAVTGGRSVLTRRHADGSGDAGIATSDGSAFDPRPSPDGKWLAYLSTDVAGAAIPDGADVTLKVIPVENGVPQPAKAATLSHFVGGPGSLAAAAWSPDSRLIAFISRD